MEEKENVTEEVNVGSENTNRTNNTQPEAKDSKPTEPKQKVVEVKAKDVNKKKKKEKKPSKLKKALKDTGNELKKVTWPKFGTVVKQTGIVLVVVLIVSLVLFGFDRLCALLYGLLLK